MVATWPVPKGFSGALDCDTCWPRDCSDRRARVAPGATPGATPTGMGLDRSRCTTLPPDGSTPATRTGRTRRPPVAPEPSPISATPMVSTNRTAADHQRHGGLAGGA